MTERHHHVKLIWLSCTGWNNGPEFGYEPHILGGLLYSIYTYSTQHTHIHNLQAVVKTIHFFGKHKSHHSDHLLGIKKETIFDDNHDNDRKLEQITTISLIYSWKKVGTSMYTLWFSYKCYVMYFLAAIISHKKGLQSWSTKGLAVISWHIESQTKDFILDTLYTCTTNTTTIWHKNSMYAGKWKTPQSFVII